MASARPALNAEHRRRISSGLRRYQQRQRDLARVSPGELEELRRSGAVSRALEPFVMQAREEAAGLVQALGGEEHVSEQRMVLVRDTARLGVLLSALLGVWLMAAPDILGSQGAAADSDHLVGALVVTIATIALAEVARPLRLLNILAGLWFVAAPWLLEGATTTSRWNDVIIGVVLVLLSLSRGKVREQYGSWNRYII